MRVLADRKQKGSRKLFEPPALLLLQLIPSRLSLEHSRHRVGTRPRALLPRPSILHAHRGGSSARGFASPWHRERLVPRPTVGCSRATPSCGSSRATGAPLLRAEPAHRRPRKSGRPSSTTALPSCCSSRAW
eukprot:2013349-Prymnesium_polylepis.3